MFKSIVDEQFAADHRRTAMQEAELERLINEIEDNQRGPRSHRLLVTLLLIGTALVTLAQMVGASAQTVLPRLGM